MIKCETNNGELELEVKGNLIDIVTDSAYVIANIYRSFQKNNKQQAKEYKRCLMIALYKLCDEIDEE